VNYLDNTNPEPAPARAWCVYLLRCADGSFYAGVTTQPARRLRQHNGELAGGPRYTRGRRPVELLACHCVSTRGEALRLEYQLKQQPREHKLAWLSALSD
jgi:putative endonuclease